MKKSSVISVVVLWVLSLFASIACAQTANHSALTVKVPFEFVVEPNLPGGNLQIPIVAQLRPE